MNTLIDKSIKVGDTVECIDDKNLVEGMHIVRKGTRYVVRRVGRGVGVFGGGDACCNSELDTHTGDTRTIYITNINNTTCWEDKEQGYKPSRFVKVSRIKINVV